jgi:hypothetical protein
MRDGELSINFYLYNLMADERQRGSHEIVQSRDGYPLGGAGIKSKETIEWFCKGISL